jgi:hypothetical protein
MNSYRISKAFYLCECQECGIYGAGVTQEDETAASQLLQWRLDGLMTDRLDHFHPDASNTEGLQLE